MRGRGLLIGLEFVADRKTRRPFDKGLRVTDKLVAQLRDRIVRVAAGIALSTFGKDGDHIQISPRFTISERKADLLVGALDESLLAVVNEIGSTTAA